MSDDEVGDIEVDDSAPTGSAGGRGLKVAVALLGVAVIGLGVAVGVLFGRLADSEELIRAQAAQLQSQGTKVDTVSQEIDDIGPQPGPRGPKGEQGPQGLLGPRGPRGYDGQDGGLDIPGCAMPMVTQITVPEINTYADTINERRYSVVTCF